jgi:hypothetical protein
MAVFSIKKWMLWMFFKPDLETSRPPEIHCQGQKQDNATTAAGLFRGPEKYNCAQAILRTFQARFAVKDTEIIAARALGHGKVPGGVCGALYAGQRLLNDESKAEVLTRDFRSLAGSSKCKKILKLKHLTCKECVALTARLLDGHLS